MSRFRFIFLFFVVGCQVKQNPAPLQSAHNGVSCDTTNKRNAGLSFFRYKIKLKDEGLEIAEKRRHLSELGGLPHFLLNAIQKKRVKIHLIKGAITDLDDFRDKRGQPVPGWNNGTTWDQVPGIARDKTAYLGPSSMRNGAFSLAVHETMHALDNALKLSERSKTLKRIYKEAKENTRAEDSLTRYSLHSIKEFIAVGVDSYYCNSTQKAQLKRTFPELHKYISQELPNEVD